MSKKDSVAGTLQKAVGLHQAGELGKAEHLYDAVLKKHPDNADALNLKGLIAHAQGRFADAVALFERAAAALPAYADIRFNMANSLKALARNDEALAAYAKAIELKPAYTDARLNAGNLLQKMGRTDEAIATFREMARIAPADPRAHYNLAVCLTEALDSANEDAREAMIAEAEQAFTKAAALNPGDANIPFAFANLKSKLGDHTAAIGLTKKALNLKPNWPEAWGNLGSHLEASGQPAAAETAFDQALRLNPKDIGAVVNRGLTQLAQGKLDKGWKAYARRFETTHALYMKRDWPWPVWGGESLEGKSIFLWSDQGIGDEILYGGMIPEIAHMAQSCVVECAPRLVPIYRRSFPNVEVLAKTQGGTEQILKRNFDYQSSILDLGQWLRGHFRAFPNRPRYLLPDLKHALRLRDRYLAETPERRLIGLSWRSANPMIGKEKSLKLADFEPLLNAPEVRLISVQYGDIGQEIERLREMGLQAPLVDKDIDSLTDLDAFAVQLAALDAVITVSNSTAHLAAALGVPVILLLPEGKKHLWYWLAQGEYSPWYRNMRIFRSNYIDNICIMKYIL